MSSAVSGDRGDGACTYITERNATSCDDRMSFTIENLSAKTSYTALMTMWNRGGQSGPSLVSVVTQASPPGQLMSLMSLDISNTALMPEWS